MTKKDPVLYAENFMKNDRMGSLFGHQIVSLDTQECISRYKVQEAHFNPNGILHGGALFAAMDSAQGAFVHYVLDEKFKFASTGTATIRYSAPVRSGVVTLRTWITETQNRKIFVSSQAYDDQGSEVARLDEIWIGILK